LFRRPRSVAHHDPPPCPTRRSSDLCSITAVLLQYFEEEVTALVTTVTALVLDGVVERVQTLTAPDDVLDPVGHGGFRGGEAFGALDADPGERVLLGVLDRAVEPVGLPLHEVGELALGDGRGPTAEEVVTVVDLGGAESGALRGDVVVR